MWLQHPDTQILLQEFGIAKEDILQRWAFLEPKSDGVIREFDIHRGAAAWVNALKYLSLPWNLIYYLAFYLVPSCLRESVYNTIAKNRYRLLGKTEKCQNPCNEVKTRLLHKMDMGGPGT